MEARLDTLTWMVGANLRLTVIVLALTFTQFTLEQQIRHRELIRQLQSYLG